MSRHKEQNKRREDDVLHKLRSWAGKKAAELLRKEGIDPSKRPLKKYRRLAEGGVIGKISGIV